MQLNHSDLHSTRRLRLRVPAMLGGAVCALALASSALMSSALMSSALTGSAHAAPSTPEIVIPTADAPVPVGQGEYSYIATHEVTKRAAGMKIAAAVASLPVPAQYRPANLALAKQFDLALAGALASPGGCVQVVVDPRSRDGSLFNYGFFPVAGQYCS
ncbi:MULTISPECIES: hypothetical protein [unclassified Gordonia (in: high G+C Gram-positive bacteria)]|uniref:hypothetical protein n=1 Tax=Gordonia sp. B7-2 TaxID=3420932 RepID=UPI003D8F2591